MEMSGKKIERDVLERHLASTLDINRFRDYCPNGLQVEGYEQIQYVVSGVTASLALIEAALDKGADTLLVHHGYFWKGEDPRVVGHRQKRLKMLLANNINLFAYHLPLDAHPLLGNNAQLGQLLGLKSDGRFGDQDLGWLGVMAPEIATVSDLARLVERVLERTPLIIGNPDQAVGRVGWCTGAAQNSLADAIAAGASVYLSGEISEQTVHLARESNVAYLACGHHATERYGVQALGRHIENQFGIRHEFVEVPNPV
jgi:dinuclear metal center YbgI/SA1388 family protein